ncbi:MULTISPECIES: sigma-70 family RNA polymerase sigma factor [unclassified Streptomyces]|uniref:sigma-70 family RNA polymerase sigma factor n=1 Tax=unclassified Streptomyces TaxID=2593676 RepID=UPI0003723E37|nr:MULTISPECIES: sigma-70 family RNA polymerase sigma factor [unclassified Streptomyces]MYY03102.1 sigma-70 family RNA polymerase sigma factor [Streptomyces sp. SID4913]
MSQTTVTNTQILAAQGGDETAMWDIVSAYEPLIRSTVRSVAPAANEDQAEDLLQEARIVLIQHIREYSTEADSASLSSFAYRALRRTVAEEWVRMSSAVTVNPVMVIRVRRALWEAAGDVDRAWTIVSTYPDVTHRISREAFVSVCEALADTGSLDAPAPGGDSGLTWADLTPDTSADFTATTERRDLARWLLTQVPPRQAYALRAFYGIGGLRQSDEQTSDEMGISSHRSCQALRKLRSRGLESARNVAAGHHITLAA